MIFTSITLEKDRIIDIFINIEDAMAFLSAPLDEDFSEIESADALHEACNISGHTLTLRI